MGHARKQHKKRRDINPGVEHKMRKAENNRVHKNMTVHMNTSASKTTPRSSRETSGTIYMVQPYGKDHVLKTIGRYGEAVSISVRPARAR